MSRPRRPRGKTGSNSFDRSLDSRIGSARPRRVKRVDVPVIEPCMREEVGTGVRSMADWPLSNIQEMIVEQDRKEAERKSTVSQLLGKGTCIAFYFGTSIRAAYNKHAANSRWITGPVEDKDYLSQVICPTNASLRCATCILNYLDNSDCAVEMRDRFPGEVSVAIGREFYAKGIDD